MGKFGSPIVRYAEYEKDDLHICVIARQSPYTRDFTSHRFFRDSILDTYAKREVLVAVSAGVRVGFIYAKHLKIKSRPWSVVHYMGVHTDWRKRGIGEQLLDAALEASPHKRIQLSCEHSNESGMKFYAACGFRPISEGVYGSDARPRPYTRFEKALP